MMTPPAAFLQAAIHHIAGYHYARGTGHMETDCCRYVEQVVRMWKEDELTDYPESKADLNVWSAAKPWSPPMACVKLGIAHSTGHYVPHAGKVLPIHPGVYLCQGWREVSPLKGGHTFLVWIPQPGTERAWCYEATTREGPWAQPVSLAEQLDKFAAGVRWARLSNG